MEKTNKITTEIINELKKHEIRAWRNNIGAVRVRGRLLRFGLKGSPDIIGYTKDGRFIGIEIKIGNDKLSNEQSQFCVDALACKCLICVTDSVQGIEKFLKYVYDP